MIGAPEPDPGHIDVRPPGGTAVAREADERTDYYGGPDFGAPHADAMGYHAGPHDPAAAWAGLRAAAPTLAGINYTGPEPSVPCAWPPCTNRLREADAYHIDDIALQPGRQWCSKAHRTLSAASSNQAAHPWVCPRCGARWAASRVARLQYSTTGLCPACPPPTAAEEFADAVAVLQAQLGAELLPPLERLFPGLAAWYRSVMWWRLVRRMGWLLAVVVVATAAVLLLRQ